ncbi:MAG: hypothetical protein R3A48_16230 [Polyangiales bacterium]
MRPLVPLALTLCLAAAAPAALGNGRFPSAQHLVGGPPGVADRLAVRTTFGLLLSLDRGQRWTFYCEDLLGLSNTSLWDAPIQFASDGSLFAGLPDGMVRLRDGCTTDRVPEIGGSFTADLTASPDGATVFWIGSTGPAANRVLVSTDGGATFSPRGTARDGVLLETVEVSGVDPQRVYVSAVQLEPRAYLLLRSTDGGRSFRELPIARGDLAGAYLAGLDPRSADGVWIRAPLRTDGGGVAGTALLYSADGGERFDEVATTTGPMLGFAVRSDGVVFYGGPDDGLWRGAPSDFRRLSTLPLTCLRHHGGALYACANHLRTGWAVGRSADDGATFEPLLRFEEIEGPPACPAGTVGASICPGRWSVLRRTLVPDAGVSRDAAVADAGAAEPPRAASCGCRAGGSGATGAALWAWLLAGLALRRRRRAMLRAPCAAPSSR